MGMRVLGLLASVAVLVLTGCTADPTPEEARDRTDQVVSAHLETAVPDGAAIVERVDDETTGCPGELAPTTRIDVDVPDGVDLLAHLEEVWAPLGDLEIIPESRIVAVEVDGVQLSGRVAEPLAILRAVGPCTGPI